MHPLGSVHRRPAWGVRSAPPSLDRHRRRGRRCSGRGRTALPDGRAPVRSARRWSCGSRSRQGRDPDNQGRTVLRARDGRPAGRERRRAEAGIADRTLSLWQVEALAKVRQYSPRDRVSKLIRGGRVSDGEQSHERIIAAEDELRRAMMANDVDALDRLLDDDLVFTAPKL